jgi:type 1 glutamine amidotransferase
MYSGRSINGFVEKRPTMSADTAGMMPMIKRSSSLRYILIAFFMIRLLTSCSVTRSVSQPIKVLLLTGQNNHNWQETTALLKQIYEQSGCFTVDVTTNPETYDQEKLGTYDVIVSNWTAWPEVTGRQWGPKMEKAFLDYIRQGKGFVLFHAASATFHDWPEYQQMVGTTWKEGETGHGPIHEFKVSIKDYNHPVTNGMTDFWIRDELWHKTAAQSGMHTLCAAYSAARFKGTQQFEPAAITTEFGAGRCFYNLLGHDAEAMQNKGWQTLMLRGTEWAATQEVTIAIPPDWPSAPKDTEPFRKFTWYLDDESIGLLNNGRFVWQHHFANVSKPWFDLNLIDGTSLTWKSPPDHPWHHGLWFSWKYINGLNYWEEEQGRSEGLTEVAARNIYTKKDGSAEIDMELSYHPPGKATLLREERHLAIAKPDSDGDYFIDWTSKFTALHETVLLERTPIEGQPGGRSWGGYATLALRMNTRSLFQIELSDNEGRKNLDIHGQPARWVTISGQSDSATTRGAAITVFDHPDNPRHPPPGYVINNMLEHHDLRFTYSNPGLLFLQGLTLDVGASIVLKYRILVHDGQKDISALQNTFDNFRRR